MCAENTSTRIYTMCVHSQLCLFCVADKCLIWNDSTSMNANKRKSSIECFHGSSHLMKMVDVVAEVWCCMVHGGSQPVNLTLAMLCKVIRVNRSPHVFLYTFIRSQLVGKYTSFKCCFCYHQPNLISSIINVHHQCDQYHVCNFIIIIFRQVGWSGYMMGTRCLSIYLHHHPVQSGLSYSHQCWFNVFHYSLSFSRPAGQFWKYCWTENW